jgi:hypothetical protein
MLLVSLQALYSLYSISLTRIAPIPALPARASAVMTALAALPSIRNPQLRKDRKLNLKRASNIEAYLGQLVGQENGVSCTHCSQKSAGSWTQCVSVAGYFQGSCANCHYNNEGIRCGFRTYFRLSFDLLQG